jgi:hypothetical protein
MKNCPDTENAPVLRTDFSDQAAWDAEEHLLLVIDLFGEKGREFRAEPSRIQSIENNLSIANMDFSDFAESCDPEGVFRGFPTF